MGQVNQSLTLHEEIKSMKYSLIIKPAIHPRERHQIEDVLKKMDYYIIGGGGHTDGSECDISFETKTENG